MEQILDAITQYGLEAVLIALAINLLTWLIKLPIKKAAQRLEDSTKVTRFIVFLPVILGFALSALWTHFFEGGFVFDHAFITLWVASSSLSLTFYAIFEKLFPSKSKVLTQEEVTANQELLQEIQSAADKAETDQTEEVKKTESKKIIVRGKTDVKTESEE